MRSNGHGRTASGVASGESSLCQQTDDAAEDEEPDKLPLGPAGHEGAREEEHPEKWIFPEGALCELVRASSDDGDDGRADAVERALHPGEAAVSEVEGREHEDHEEGRENESDRDERRAEDTVVEPAEVDRELRGKRPGGELREREALLVVLQR